MSFSVVQPAIHYPDENVTGAGSVPLTSANEALPLTMDCREDTGRVHGD